MLLPNHRNPAPEPRQARQRIVRGAVVHDDDLEVRARSARVRFRPPPAPARRGCKSGSRRRRAVQRPRLAPRFMVVCETQFFAFVRRPVRLAPALRVPPRPAWAKKSRAAWRNWMGRRRRGAARACPPACPPRLQRRWKPSSAVVRQSGTKVDGRRPAVRRPSDFFSSATASAANDRASRLITLRPARVIA